MLSERQRLFLTRRQRALRWWPVGAAVVGLLWLGLVAWLWVAHPLLVNPFALQQHLQREPPATGSLLLMAAMVPLLVDLCLLLTLALVLFVAVAVRNERNYQDILQGLGGRGSASGRL